MIFHDNREWLKNRFQSMESGEVISRFTDVGRHLALRTSLKRLEQRAGRKSQKRESFYRLPEITDQLDKVSTRAQNAVIAAANHWLDHYANFFSLRDVPLGDPIDWHRDYSSGVMGPKRYSALINSRDTSKVGDIKYVWELNRLQHLILLALAWSWTKDNVYGEEIQKQVLSWNRSNPFMMGVIRKVHRGEVLPGENL